VLLASLISNTLFTPMVDCLATLPIIRDDMDLSLCSTLDTPAAGYEQVQSSLLFLPIVPSLLSAALCNPRTTILFSLISNTMISPLIDGLTASLPAHYGGESTSGPPKPPWSLPFHPDIDPGPGEEVHLSIQFENVLLHLLFFVRPVPDVGMTAQSTPLSAVGTVGLSLWVRPRDHYGCGQAVATGGDQDVSADTGLRTGSVDMGCAWDANVLFVLLWAFPGGAECCNCSAVRYKAGIKTHSRNQNWGQLRA
jgi:hypothetical protein